MIFDRLVWRSFFVITVLWAVIPPAAHAAEPCEHLEGEQRAEYQRLGAEGNTAYQSGDYVTAAKFMAEAQKICDEDPRAQYNLARSYHQAGNCNMGLFWYEQVMELEGGEFAEQRKNQREKAASYFAQLEAECAGSARVAVECQDEGVLLTLGELTQSCPFDGRVDAGSYKLTAVKDGFQPYQADVVLNGGERIRLLVPELKALVAGPTVGVLKLSCPVGLDSVSVAGGDFHETVPCPNSLELAPGVYAIDIGEGDAQQISILAGDTVELRVGPTTEVVRGETMGVFISVRVSPGSGATQGELFDKNGDSLFVAQNLDGLEPSVMTVSLKNELGYMFHENWGAALQARFDVVNLSIMVGAFARWLQPLGHSLSLRIDVGAGAGELRLPVQLRGEDVIYLTKAGPINGVASVSLAWWVGSVVSLVGGIDFYVGFPELGLVADWASVGVEVDF